MMYPFMELNDGTCIVHSEPLVENDKERVKVYIEKPDEDLGFRHATCWLPDYTWEDVEGFSDEEMKYLKEFVESTASVIIKFARQGGFGNAAGF